MLALGGFREETLSKLRYYHVKEDLEANKTPMHIHVEAEITKGKYSDYDTFIDQEAASYLRLYLQQRTQGSPDGRNPPENLDDESPLIRDETKRSPRGIGPKQIRKVVHNLYARAGLLKMKRGRMYDLRVHSLRKFFKTQLLALGVQPDYVDYMMGHVVDTYHDVEMKGFAFLRNVYSASELSIRPQTKANKMEIIKEIIRTMGLNPEQVLTREALTQPARTYIDFEDRQDKELTILSNTLREIIRQDAVNTIQTGQIRTGIGGPDGN